MNIYLDELIARERIGDAHESMRRLAPASAFA